MDLTNFDKEVYVDIRENGYTYIFLDKIHCAGGMPVGSSGKALCLLSGGIDSPVAAYMMAKRGLQIDAIHFHSMPYTSEQAKEKVVSLAKSFPRTRDTLNFTSCRSPKFRKIYTNSAHPNT